MRLRQPLWQHSSCWMPKGKIRMPSRRDDNRESMTKPFAQRTLGTLPEGVGQELQDQYQANLDAMVALHAQRPQLHFVIPAANAARREQIQTLLASTADLPVTVVDGQSRTVMAAADVILMASGTATLEGLLVGKPMVVGYRVGKVTYAIASRLVKSEFVSLPNLLCREQLVPELIQDGLTPNWGHPDPVGHPTHGSKSLPILPGHSP